jgi:hypothetical protein
VSAAVTGTANADKVRELHDRLIAQVEALVSGEDWGPVPEHGPLPQLLNWVQAGIRSFRIGSRNYPVRPSPGRGKDDGTPRKWSGAMPA